MIDQALLNSFVKAHPFYGELFYFEEIPSTNDFAKKTECKANSLVLTSFQSSGRGRYDRKWISEPDVNLTFSLKLKLDLSPAENRYLIYFTSLMVYECIKEILEIKGESSAGLSIKWPNDILWNNRKLAGILTESVVKSGEYIIGIGINVNQKNFGSAIEAISISEITNQVHDLNSVLVHFLTKFEKKIQMLEKENYPLLFDLWKKSTRMIGKKCSYLSANASLKHGFIKDLNEDGSITIESAGVSASYISGEVKILNY